MMWDYGGFYKDYDMTGEIHIGTGIVQVHDIFNPLPAFMRKADIIFCDPPYNKSALSSYYTKAGLSEKPDSFDAFFYRLIECLDVISPHIVILEVGVPQTFRYVEAIRQLFPHLETRRSWYYGNKQNKCSIICAGKEPLPDVIADMPETDEEKVIEYICKNLEYSCIGDLCMGKGLVGYYSNKYGKPFVGTELNPKRLAVCCERVSKNKRGKIL